MTDREALGRAVDRFEERSQRFHRASIALLASGSLSAAGTVTERRRCLCDRAV